MVMSHLSRRSLLLYSGSVQKKIAQQLLDLGSVELFYDLGTAGLSPAYEDLSGKTRHGTAAGTITVSAGGITPNGGSGSYISVGNLPVASTPMQVITFVFTCATAIDANSGLAYLMYGESTSRPRVALSGGASTFTNEVILLGNRQTDASAFEYNAWVSNKANVIPAGTHILQIRRRGNYRNDIYLDGELKLSTDPNSPYIGVLVMKLERFVNCYLAHTFPYTLNAVLIRSSDTFTDAQLAVEREYLASLLEAKGTTYSGDVANTINLDDWVFLLSGVAARDIVSGTAKTEVPDQYGLSNYADGKGSQYGLTSQEIGGYLFAYKCDDFGTGRYLPCPPSYSVCAYLASDSVFRVGGTALGNLNWGWNGQLATWQTAVVRCNGTEIGLYNSSGNPGVFSYKTGGSLPVIENFYTFGRTDSTSFRGHIGITGIAKKGASEATLLAAQAWARNQMADRGVTTWDAPSLPLEESLYDVWDFSQGLTGLKSGKVFSLSAAGSLVATGLNCDGTDIAAELTDATINYAPPYVVAINATTHSLEGTGTPVFANSTDLEREVGFYANGTNINAVTYQTAFGPTLYFSLGSMPATPFRAFFLNSPSDAHYGMLNGVETGPDSNLDNTQSFKSGIRFAKRRASAGGIYDGIIHDFAVWTVDAYTLYSKWIDAYLQAKLAEKGL